MAFNFDWRCFTEENFYGEAKTLLTRALNRGSLPPILADRVQVRTLDLGTKPPELEILEIGVLSSDRFQGIFKLHYDGDAYITLQTKVEANPLNVAYSSSIPKFASPNFLSAISSLTLPLTLTLSRIRLNGIVIVVYSKAKGLTIVFRNDPLESISVNSTFDSITPIARYLQQEIEERLRLLFSDELPAIIHQLSQSWPKNSVPLNASSDSSSTPSSTSTSSPEKPISLAELNPGLPLFSSSSTLQLNALAASQNTLSLFTPKIFDAAYKSSISLSSNPSAPLQPSSLLRHNLKNAYSRVKRRTINLRNRNKVANKIEENENKNENEKEKEKEKEKIKDKLEDALENNAENKKKNENRVENDKEFLNEITNKNNNIKENENESKEIKNSNGKKDENKTKNESNPNTNEKASEVNNTKINSKLKLIAPIPYKPLSPSKLLAAMETNNKFQYNTQYSDKNKKLVRNIIEDQPAPPYQLIWNNTFKNSQPYEKLMLSAIEKLSKDASSSPVLVHSLPPYSYT